VQNLEIHTEVAVHLNAKERRTGEVIVKNVENNASTSDEHVKARDELKDTCDGPKEHDKLGAPMNKLEVQDSELKDIIVLPKITLPKFNGEIIKFRGFWDRY